MEGSGADAPGYWAICWKLRLKIARLSHRSPKCEAALRNEAWMQYHTAMECAGP
jgi:hypothetical protein